MTIRLPALVEAGPLCAVLFREFRGALVNRYFQVFSALALTGGLAALVAGGSAHTAAYLILQMVLYFVSLFALLVGISSARAESEEWPMLFVQPVPRGAFVIGKFLSVWSIFGAVLLLLFAPAFFQRESTGQIAQLYGHALGLVAVFASIGLAAGFLTCDRVQGLILGVSAWLFLLVGVDVVAMLAARWAVLQRHPDLWVGLLMANPLDAFRVQGLFAVEQVPAEMIDKTPLAHWWLTHTSLWFAVLSACWAALFIGLTVRRLNDWEE